MYISLYIGKIHSYGIYRKTQSHLGQKRKIYIYYYYIYREIYTNYLPGKIKRKRGLYYYIYREIQSQFPAIKEKEKRYYIYSKNINNIIIVYR